MWEWFNGHKRQIGGGLFALVIFAQQMSGQIGDPAWLATAIQWATWVGTTFFAIGWGHAVKKMKS